MSNEGSPSPSTSSATNATTTAASPEANGALKVAIVFVKQYYKCLSSHPDMLQRFYSALPDKSSYLSAGEGSEPTEPALLADSTPTGHDRWGCSEGEKMLFEFEDGAIDAQPSSNDGILMVVTASVIFKSGGGGGASCIERKKKFVQTFFLAKIGRNFAVTNDILRFLVEAESQDKATETESLSFPIVEPSVTEAVPVPEMKSTTVTTEEEKKSESTSISTNEDKKAGETSGDESSAPGGGVEESKEEAPEEEEGSSTTAEAAPAKTANAKKRSNSKENKGKKNKGGKQQQQQQQQQPAVSKPVPGSWASLVVSGGSAPNTPSRPQEKTTKVATANEKPTNASKQPPLPPSDNTNKEEQGESEKKGTQEKDKSAVAAAATTTTNAGAGAKQNTKNDNKANQKGNNNNKENQNHNNNKERTKRDPDNTLVIKNLSENIKEQDILNMFQPFATATKTKIVGTNLNHHRMLAFVDYDGVAPVMAALKKHKETPFEWNGKVLEVDQKTMEQRARRNKAATNSNGYNRNSNHNAGRGGNNNSSNNNKFNNNNNQNNNNTNGRGDGGNNNDRGGRRRGTRAGR